jgi:hypothetical protein
LPFFNCLSDILVVFDFHTFILFQLDCHPLPVYIILISLSQFSYNFSAKCRRILDSDYTYGLY